MSTYYRGYLAHHGIKGQKWGHRQGPPYPLKPGNHSAAENKAGWRSSLDGGTHSSPQNGGDSSSSEHKPIHFKKHENSSEQKSSAKKHKRELTDEEKAERRKKRLKRLAIGLGAAAGIAGTAYLAKKGMKYINDDPTRLARMSEKLTQSKLAKELADFDHTTKEFKNNVQENISKTRYNLEATQRERARQARTNFDKVESEYIGAHKRANDQRSAADAIDFIRKNRNNEHDVISRSKARDLMKQYNIADHIDDESLKSRANIHRNAAGNIERHQRDMTEAYQKALAEYMAANGSNEKSKRKRAKLQRIMREAMAERR